MKKSYAKSKNLSKKILATIALGASLPIMTSGLAGAETIYQIRGNTTYTDSNDLNGPSQAPGGTGRNIVELGSSRLSNESGSLSLGNIILGNSVINPDLMNGPNRQLYAGVNFPDPATMTLSGTSVTAGDVSVFTVVVGEPRNYGKSSLTVDVTGDATFHNMTNFPPGDVKIPNRALGVNNDSVTTTGLGGFGYRNSSVTVNANNIKANNINVSGATGITGILQFSYTATNNIDVNDVNTKASGIVTLSAANDVNTGSLVTTDGGVEPSKIEITNVKNLHVKGPITATGSSVTANAVRGTVTIDGDVSSTTSTVKINNNDVDYVGNVTIAAQGKATVKGLKSTGKNAILSITGAGAEASGAVGSENGGHTTLAGGEQAVSAGSATSTGENSATEVTGNGATVTGSVTSDNKSTTTVNGNSGEVTVGTADQNNKVSSDNTSHTSVTGSKATVHGDVTSDHSGTTEVTGANGATVDGSATSDHSGTTTIKSANGTVTVGTKDKGNVVSSDNGSTTTVEGTKATVNGDAKGTAGGTTNVTSTAADTASQVTGNVNADGGTVNVTAQKGATVGGDVKSNQNGAKALVDGNGGAVTVGTKDKGNVVSSDNGSTTTVQGTAATVNGNATADKGGTTNVTSSNGDAKVDGNAIAGSTPDNAGTVNVTSTGGDASVTGTAEGKGKGTVNVTANGDKNATAGAVKTSEEGTVNIKAPGNTAEVTNTIEATGTDKTHKSTVDVEGKSAKVGGDITALNATVTVKGTDPAGSTEVKGATANTNGTIDIGVPTNTTTVKGDLATGDRVPNDGTAAITVEGKNITTAGIAAKANGTITVGDKDNTSNTETVTVGTDAKPASVGSTGENAKTTVTGKTATVNGNVSAATGGTTNILSKNGAANVTGTVDANNGTVKITGVPDANVGGTVSTEAGGKATVDGGTGTATVGTPDKTADATSTGDQSKTTITGNKAVVHGNATSDSKGITEVLGTNGATVDGNATSDHTGTTTINGNGGAVTVGTPNNNNVVSSDNGSHTTVQGTTATVNGNATGTAGGTTEVKSTAGASHVTGDVTANGGTVNVTGTPGATVDGAVTSEKNGDKVGAATVDAGTGKATVGSASSTGAGSTTTVTGADGAESKGAVESSAGGKTKIDGKNNAATVGSTNAPANATSTGDGSDTTVTGASATVNGNATADQGSTTNVTSTNGAAKVTGNAIAGSTPDNAGTVNVTSTGGDASVTGTAEAKGKGTVNVTANGDKKATAGAVKTSDQGTVNVKAPANTAEVTGEIEATGTDKDKKSTVDVEGKSAKVGGNITASNATVTVKGTDPAGSTEVDGITTANTNGTINIGDPANTTTVNGKLTTGDDVKADGPAAIKVDGKAITTKDVAAKANGTITVGDKDKTDTATVGNADADGANAVVNVAAKGKATATTASTENGGAVNVTGNGAESTGAATSASGGKTTIDGTTGEGKAASADSTGDGSKTVVKGATAGVTNNATAEDKGTTEITATGGKATVGGDVTANGGTVKVTGAPEADVTGKVSSATTDGNKGTAEVNGGTGKATVGSADSTGKDSTTTVTGVGAESKGAATSSAGGKTTIDGTTGEGKAVSADSTGKDSVTEVKGNTAKVTGNATSDNNGTTKVTGANGATVDGNVSSDNGGTTTVDGGTGAAVAGTQGKNNTVSAGNGATTNVVGGSATVNGPTSANSGTVNVTGNSGDATVNGPINTTGTGKVNVTGKSGAADVNGAITATGTDKDNKSTVDVTGDTANVTGDIAATNATVTVKGTKNPGGSTTVQGVTANGNGTVNVGDQNTDTNVNGNITTAKDLPADTPAVVNVSGKNINTGTNNIAADTNGNITVGSKTADPKTASVTTNDVSANGANSSVTVSADGPITANSAKSTDGGKVTLDGKPVNVKTVSADGTGSKTTINSDGPIGNLEDVKASNNGKVELHTTGAFTIDNSGKPKMTTESGGKIDVNADGGINAEAPITASGVDYTSKGDINVKDVVTDPNKPNSTQITGKDVTTGNLTAKTGGSIGVTGDEKVNVNGNIIADGKDAKVAVKQNKGELDLLGAPGDTIEAKNGGNIVLDAPEGINITAPNVVADGVAKDATGKPVDPTQPSTITIGSVDQNGTPTVTKPVKVKDLEAYNGARVNVASQNTITVDTAKADTTGQLTFTSTKDNGDGVTITNLTSAGAPVRPEPKPDDKKPLDPNQPPAPPEVMNNDYASVVINAKNAHVVNLTGDPSTEHVGRILLGQPGSTLTIDNVKSGTQEFGLDLNYSTKPIKSIDPNGTVESDRLIFTNGASTPQKLAINDNSYNNVFKDLTEAKADAKKNGKQLNPIVPFAAVLNPGSPENTFKVGLPATKWNKGKVVQDVLIVKSAPYADAKLGTQFQNYFNNPTANELIYYVALKSVANNALINSVLSNGEQIYNLAIGDSLAINRGYGMVKGIQANNSVGIWAEATAGRAGYNDLYKGTLTGVNVGYNLKADKKATVGIGVDYTNNSGSVDGVSSDSNGNALALNVYQHGTLKDNVYYNIQGKLGQARSSFAYNNDGDVVKGKQKATFGQISGEVDKMKDLGDGKYLSTQGELRLTRIGGRDYATTNEVVVKAENMTSLLSRVGVVFGQEKTNDQGLKTSYYVNANLFHEFAGNVKVALVDDAGDVYNYDVKNRGTWGSLGLGYKSQLSSRTSAFVDLGHTIGGHKSIGTLHVGAKWLF